MRIQTLFVLALLFQQCQTPPPPPNATAAEGLLRSFLEIPSEARTIPFSNQLEVNNEGGHLQGVQMIRSDTKEYAVLSGSSSSYAYYAVARLGAEAKVIHVQKILDKPFKHAGGFQIHNKMMAIGVEDNEAKDRSKIFVYRIEDPESPPKTPLTIIERQGEAKRATAGCIGLTQLHDQLLLVAGDWDSKHLDFYTASYTPENNQPLIFQKVSAIDTEKVEKSTWSDPSWLSYQNINLFKDAENKLYLIGLGGNALGQDVADLYELLSKDMQNFQLKKLASHRFAGQRRTKFRWGAGVNWKINGKMELVSCGGHLDHQSILNLY